MKYDKILTKNILEKEYLECKSSRVIAKKYNISSSTVISYMKKYGLSYNRPKSIRYPCNDDYFSNDTEGSFYWAGFLLADGCVSDDGKSLAVGLGNKDKNHLEKFKSDILSESKILYNKTNNSYIIHITSEKNVSALLRFGIVPRKSKIVKFPMWLLNHPLVNHFMRGYFDGDGSFWFYNNKKRVNPQLYFNIRGTEDFLINYRNILEQNLSLKLRNTKLPFATGIYGLNYGGNIICSKVADFLYKDATIFLQRKYDIAQLAKSLIIPIKLREKLTKEILIEVYNRVGTQAKTAKELNYSLTQICIMMKKFNIPNNHIKLKNNGFKNKL